MSFICCGKFMFFMADTARAGAALMPAYNTIQIQALDLLIYWYQWYLSLLSGLLHCKANNNE